MPPRNKKRATSTINGKFTSTSSTSTFSNQHKHNKKRDRQLARAKDLLKTVYGITDNDTDTTISEEEKIQYLIAKVEKCMNDLQQYNQLSFNSSSSSSSSRQKKHSSMFDMQALTDSIQEAANRTQKRNINEIICYGIGNFNGSSGSSSTRYNAPMVQLACVLLLRRAFSKSCIDIVGAEEGSEGSGNDGTNIHIVPYEQQQGHVKMVYFEPFIQPIERKVLAYFHVQVLDKNEQGKRSIAKNTLDGKHEMKSKEDVTTSTSTPTSTSTSAAPCTFFYMPHCPMRLYSNVLWANWKEDIIMNGRMVIFGNSFRAYDERIISSEQKKDTTNAIFPLLSFANETEVLYSKGNFRRNANSGNSGRYHEMDLTGQDLETAFYASVVISCSNKRMDPFPPQPHEYDGGENGELL